MKANESCPSLLRGALLVESGSLRVVRGVRTEPYRGGAERLATELGPTSPVQTQSKKIIVLPGIEHVKRVSIEQLMQK
jgi:hypothetical protein